MINYVSDYIDKYYAGTIKLNKERIDLIKYIEREIAPRLENKEVFFDKKQIESCVGFVEKWFFKLEDFQKFFVSFVFLKWSEEDSYVYEKFLLMLGRGGGKNGLISGISSYLLTPMHGIPKYNISLVANSEDQAKTSFDEILDAVEVNDKLQQLFYTTKTEIKSYQTRSIMRYKTSNGKTKDGLRDGAVIFDEIHEFEGQKQVDVYINGLGKVQYPREFYIGTDGYVRDGFIDQMKELAQKVLSGKAGFNDLFPFICKLDDQKEVDDSENWEKANPMFSLPRSEYAKRLFRKVFSQYNNLDSNPSGREDFMTKRMNLPVTNTETSVATHEELVATKKEFPELTNRPAIGGFDFASIRDFISVGALFRIDEEYVFKTHSFVRKEFVDQTYGYSKPKDTVNGKRQFAPIRKWEEQGLLTVVDEPSMSPKHVARWFAKLRDEDGVDFIKICGDRFRLDLIGPAFEEFDFSMPEKFTGKASEEAQVNIIVNPRAIDSLLAPRIEDAFANHRVNFGDNDMMRWYTKNVLRRLKSDGNVEYVKKEDVRRKTDGFKAFEYAMFKADELTSVSSGNIYESMGWFFD